MLHENSSPGNVTGSPSSATNFNVILSIYVLLNATFMGGFGLTTILSPAGISFTKAYMGLVASPFLFQPQAMSASMKLPCTLFSLYCQQYARHNHTVFHQTQVCSSKFVVN